MGCLRRNRWVLSLIAILALSINTVAGGFCCAPRSSDAARQIYDDVLGWVTICLPSKLAAGAKNLPGSNTGSGHSVHHDCATHCAAATALVVPGVTTDLVYLSSAEQKLPFADLQAPHRHFSPGGLGSRALPLQA